MRGLATAGSEADAHVVTALGYTNPGKGVAPKPSGFGVKGARNECGNASLMVQKTDRGGNRLGTGRCVQPPAEQNPQPGRTLLLAIWEFVFVVTRALWEFADAL